MSGSARRAAAAAAAKSLFLDKRAEPIDSTRDGTRCPTRLAVDAGAVVVQVLVHPVKQKTNMDTAGSLAVLAVCTTEKALSHCPGFAPARAGVEVAY
jgi:hypothetical protein